jgi:hypothetical protein
MGLLDFADWDLGGVIVGFVTNVFEWLVGILEEVLGL